MAPAAFRTVYSFFALIAIPQVLAGPGCARNHYGKDDCVEKCRSGWGGGNNYMGGDPWGSVMKSFNSPEADLDSIISAACGVTGTPTPGPALTPTNSPPSYPDSPSIHPGSDTPSTPATSPTPNRDPSPSSGTPTTVPTSTHGSPSPRSSPLSSPSSSPPSSPPSSSLPSPSLAPSPPPPPPPSSSSFFSTPTNNSPSPSPSLVKGLASDLGGDTMLTTLKADALNAHNDVRAQHGATPLTWSDTLATAAGTWAEKCIWDHSQGAVGPYGECLYATTGSLNATSAVQFWASEASSYDPNNPVASHFTQVVWKSTTEVGCAGFQCSPGTVVADDKTDPAWIMVCEYNPPGNVNGEFAENVQA